MDKRWYAATTLGAALLVAGCGSSANKGPAGGKPESANAPSNAAAVSPALQSAGAGAVLTLRSSAYGQVISAANHRALYLFGADHTSASTCYGVCATAWPPLLTKGAPTGGAGVDSGLLGAARRKDGTLQVTYSGHPLYYYSGDTGTKIMCQAANMHGGFWYVVNGDGTANMAKGKGMKM
jgi:predicted lipoprotein with Yx(FWY)xxD motif